MWQIEIVLGHEMMQGLPRHQLMVSGIGGEFQVDGVCEKSAV